MGWGALGCSNPTASWARGGVARDVTPIIARITPICCSKIAWRGTRTVRRQAP